MEGLRGNPKIARILERALDEERDRVAQKSTISTKFKDLQ